MGLEDRRGWMGAASVNSAAMLGARAMMKTWLLRVQGGSGYEQCSWFRLALRSLLLGGSGVAAATLAEPALLEHGALIENPID